MSGQKLSNPFPTAELMHWYEREKRNLPWRGSIDPYVIWISEVILQQTRVDQGTPYFHRFLSAFPTVTALANASEDAVLKLWEGLGYYSRARNLHAAAKQVAHSGNGIFPNSYDALRALKGVGPYTAAAIGSIAFNIPTACVDGNVTRVLTRFHGINEPVDASAVIKLVDALAQEALDRERPGEHNQAMMELGATICTPKNAQCASCPLKNSCMAARLELVDTIPWKAKRTKVRDRYLHYLVLSDGKQTLLERRPEGDIWQGLYQFPLVEADKLLDADEAIWNFGIQGEFRIAAVSGPYKHLLSHQRIFGLFIEVHVAELNPAFGSIVLLEELGLYALPRLLNRYLDEKILADSKKV